MVTLHHGAERSLKWNVNIVLILLVMFVFGILYYIYIYISYGFFVFGKLFASQPLRLNFC